MHMAMAASASAACLTAARCCVFPTASGRGPWHEFADITDEILAPALARAGQLDFFIIGVGPDPWVLPASLRERFRAVNLSVDPMTTGPAVRTYNILLAENRRVGAGLIAVD